MSSRGITQRSSRGITQRESRRQARDQHRQALAALDRMYRDHELDTIDQVPGYTATRDRVQQLQGHAGQAGALLRPLSKDVFRSSQSPSNASLRNRPTGNYGLPKQGENKPPVNTELEEAQAREQQRQSFLQRELKRQMSLADEASNFQGSGFVPAPLEDLVYKAG